MVLSPPQLLIFVIISVEQILTHSAYLITLLHQDIKRVTGKQFEMSNQISGKNVIIIGSIKKCFKLIDPGVVLQKRVVDLGNLKAAIGVLPKAII